MKVSIQGTKHATEIEIDADDWDHLKSWAWYRFPVGKAIYVAGHPRGRGRRPKQLLMHRVIMSEGLTDALQVDHIDGNPLNNTRANLRVVTPTQNKQNVGIRNTRGNPIGVAQLPGGRWRVRMEHAGTSFHLGVYDTQEQAAEAAIDTRREWFGEFARY